MLEADVTYGNEMISFLTYDEEHHRIAIANMPVLLRRPAFMACMEHLAFTCRDLGDLLETQRRLERSGIEPYWSVNHGGTTSSYYADPDGNRVELQIDNFATEQELNEFLYGPAFQINSIGVDFDPRELARRHEAGESHSALVCWGEVEARGPETIPSAHLGRLHALFVKLAHRRRLIT